MTLASRIPSSAPLVAPARFPAVFLAAAEGAFTLAAAGPLLRARYLVARPARLGAGDPEPAPVAP